MDFRSFKTPDGKIHVFPEVFAEQAKKMLENFWVPEYYSDISHDKWPIGLAKGRVVEVTQ